MATPAGQMTVTLTKELEQFVRDKVREGAFATPSEYVRDLVRERYLDEQERVSKLRTLEAALMRGLADAEAGRVVPAAEAFAEIRKQLGLPDPRPVNAGVTDDSAHDALCQSASV